MNYCNIAKITIPPAAPETLRVTDLGIQLLMDGMMQSSVVVLTHKDADLNSLKRQYHYQKRNVKNIMINMSHCATIEISDAV
jgi:hypothetical protein